jgi:hypothetical protein
MSGATLGERGGSPRSSVKTATLPGRVVVAFLMGCFPPQRKPLTVLCFYAKLSLIDMGGIQQVGIIDST